MHEVSISGCIAEGSEGLQKCFIENQYNYK